MVSGLNDTEDLPQSTWWWHNRRHDGPILDVIHTGVANNPAAEKGALRLSPITYVPPICILKKSLNTPLLTCLYGLLCVFITHCSL